MGSPALGAAFLRFLIGDGSNGGEHTSEIPVLETFDRIALGECGIHSIRGGVRSMQCRCIVGPRTRNGFSTLHGGCIATLIDVVSSAALVTVWGSPGVSMSMNVNYTSPGRADAVLEVRAQVVHLTKRMATMTVEIVDPVHDDRMISHGTHVKMMSRHDRPLQLDTTPSPSGESRNSVEGQGISTCLSKL